MEKLNSSFPTTETQELQLTQEASQLLNDIRNDIRSHSNVEDVKKSINLFDGKNQENISSQSDYRDTAYQDRYQDTAYRDTSTYNDNAGYRDGTVGI